MRFGWVYNSSLFVLWKGRKFFIPFCFCEWFSCWYLLKYIGDKVLPQEKGNEEKILKCVTSRFESFVIYLQSVPLYLRFGNCRFVLLHSNFFQTYIIMRPLKKCMINCSVAGSDLKLWPCTSRAIMPYCLHLLLACFKVSCSQGFKFSRVSKA